MSELVTAVMPTSGSPERRKLARLAIESFRRQTHPNRRLLILNHGDVPFGLADDNIREEMVQRPPTLGELRNLAFDYLEPGTWAITWDDDDWHGQYRMHRQLSHALKVKQRAVILSCYMTVDLTSGEGFVRQGRKFRAGGCCGTILWQVGRERYPPRDMHEDSDFAVHFKERKQLGVIANPPSLYIRTCHGGNTTPREFILGRRLSRELYQEEREQLDEVLREFKKLGVI